MIRLPPRSKRTATRFPSATLSRAPGGAVRVLLQGPAEAARQHLAHHRVVVAGLSGGALADRADVELAIGVLEQPLGARDRSEEHTSELQSLMRISYAVLCLKQNREHKSIPSSHIIIKRTQST